MHQIAKETTPTIFQALAFGFKAICFRIRRTMRDFSGGPLRLDRAAIDDKLPVIAESRSLLYPNELSAEFGLQAGKVHNLRIAVRHLNGCLMPANEVFSFWKHIPRPTKWRGFTEGRELREGCIIPSIGGGICQLSNALYDCALKAGLEIVERHGHSRTLPGSMAEQGRDATIFWNYVDLRFRSNTDLQIEAVIGKGELVIRFRAKERPEVKAKSTEGLPAVYTQAGDPVESCETCGITDCFRHPQTLALAEESTTAWLVDAFWPEHNNYLARHRTKNDWLFTPLDRGNYQWNTDGFARVRKSPWLVAKRSFVSRRLAQQGAARQRTLLEFDEKLAASFARRIPPEALHLVVSQNLLPYLWRDGVLGGRTFDVLMTRLPLAQLQSTLDEAATRWPESTTLADFRADPELLEAERFALAEADHWITPHSQIAGLAGARAIKLDWEIPISDKPSISGERILFPASTLGRKGAWELRELGLPLTIAGPVLEAPNFWNGCDAERRDFSLDGVAAVILPAWVENQPRRLLQAVAADIPVIASDACGLDGVDGVQVVQAGDLAGMREAVENRTEASV